MIFVRVGESIAIAMVAASVAALLILPILWYGGRNGFELAIGALAVGTVAGFLWGVARRPTRLESAIEADRRLNLHDLLGTVYLLLHKSGNDCKTPEDVSTPAWEKAIVAMAEQRCQNLSATEVITSRVTPRAWAGVGLLASLVLTLGLMIGRTENAQANSPADANAQQPGSSQTMPRANKNQNQNETQIAGDPRFVGRPAGSETIDENSNRMGNNSTVEDTINSNSIEQGQPDRAHNLTSGNSDAGSGAGRSTTNALQPNLTRNSIDAAGSNATNSDTGAMATGSGRANSNPGTVNIAPNESPTGTVSPNVGRGETIPPWQTEGWQSDTQAAQTALQNGQVPDDAADLVRDYFQRN
jgi:hypothetical protein